jgi:hypothetical protein
LPVHAETFRDRREPGLKGRESDREIGGGEYDPHKKLPGLHVIELLGVKNVLPIWARNVETAETMPGRSGQDKVNTY